MNVVGHHAPSVNGHASGRGMVPEDVNGGGGDGRTGETGVRPFTATVIEQILPMSA